MREMSGEKEIRQKEWETVRFNTNQCINGHGNKIKNIKKPKDPFKGKICVLDEKTLDLKKSEKNATLPNIVSDALYLFMCRFFFFFF